MEDVEQKQRRAVPFEQPRNDVETRLLKGGQDEVKRDHGRVVSARREEPYNVKT